MKIFYTARFKEEISKPYKKLHLGRYRLRTGQGLRLTSDDVDVGTEEIRLSSDLIETKVFYETNISPSRDYTTGARDQYYMSEGIEYDGGVQMFLEIPENDQSLYSHLILDGDSSGTLYQVIIFFFQDQTNGEDGPVHPAFIVFEEFGKIDEENTGFYGLALTSRKNIITTPPLPDCRCKFVFEQSMITEELEKSWGNIGGMIGSYSEDDDKKYISLVSWKNHWLDVVAGEETSGWLETSYINKFGIKIY